MTLPSRITGTWLMPCILSRPMASVAGVVSGMVMGARAAGPTISPTVPSDTDVSRKPFSSIHLSL